VYWAFSVINFHCETEPTYSLQYKCITSIKYCISIRILHFQCRVRLYQSRDMTKWEVNACCICVSVTVTYSTDQDIWNCTSYPTSFTVFVNSTSTCTLSYWHFKILFKHDSQTKCGVTDISKLREINNLRYSRYNRDH
jgi:hypothetical protein